MAIINNKIYAYYKGEEFICEGTLDEISEKTGIKYKNLLYYKTPTYLERAKKGNCRMLIEIGNPKITKFVPTKSIQTNQIKFLNDVESLGYTLREISVLTAIEYDRLYRIFRSDCLIRLEEVIKIALTLNLDIRKYMEVE